jgi:hypothetical protein
MIKSDNKQISVVVPNEIYELLKAEGEKELRTISKQAAKIIIDYYKKSE